MRDGWERMRIADLVEPITTIDPRKEPNKAFTYIDVSSISRETFQILETTQLKGANAPSRARRLVKQGDIIFATIRPTLQRIAEVPKALDGAVCSTGYFVLRPKQKVLTRFLFYSLFTREFSDSMAALQRGAAYPAVSDGDVRHQELSIPPLPEQKRIVALLDEAFAGIATAVSNTERNLANARELFESYLNAVFLKGAHVWTRRRLEDVCEKITVGHVGSMAQRYKPEGIPLLRSQNIRPFRVDLENVVYIDEEFHSELKKSALKPGDLGIVRTGYPGTAAVIPDTLPVSNCSDLVIVRPGNQVLSSFLALVFNSTFGKQTVAGVLVGAAQKHFNVTAAKAALVPIPSREEQAHIVIETGEVRQECEKLEAICQQKLNALAELKQSLLQKAFSGELIATPQDEIETALA